MQTKAATSDIRSRGRSHCHVDFLAHIQRILRLELAFGSTVQYRQLERSRFAPVTDDIGLQRAAKEIRDFLGLAPTVFIVGRAKQKHNVAGHIELDPSSPRVFIEVASEIAGSTDQLLATLAHEITHHFLEVNGIRATDHIEYEIFTDTAAIYLGLGKLILGSEGSVGYLSAAEATFVYLVVCTMRRIPESDYIAGLSADGVDRLRRLELEGNSITNAGWHADQGAQTKKDVTLKLDKLQCMIGDVEPALCSLSSLVEAATNWLEQVHRHAADVQAAINAMTSPDEFNPCVRYLQSLDNMLRIRSGGELFEEQIQKSKTISSEIGKLIKFTSASWQKIGLHNHSKEGLVICRRCKTDLRIGKDVQLRKIRCPNCKYTFYARTLPPNRSTVDRLSDFFGS